jgi:hypothetical protein
LFSVTNVHSGTEVEVASVWWKNIWSLVRRVGFVWDDSPAARFAIRAFLPQDWKDHVRLKIWETSRSEWLSDLAAKPHLAVYRQMFAPSGPIFRRFHLWPWRRLRQFIQILRAGSLPVQCSSSKAAAGYRFGGVHGSSLCFMCSLGVPESQEHFMFECPAYISIKSRFSALARGLSWDIWPHIFLCVSSLDWKKLTQCGSRCGHSE